MNVSYKDFLPMWQGLNMALLRDIWTTHKVFIFGASNYSEYTLKEFAEEISRAETADSMFGEKICSQYISCHAEFTEKCNLYPSWLIRDDLFEIMNYHFAVSDWINQVTMKKDLGNNLNVISCVIPKERAVSLYDEDVAHVHSFSDIEEYLEVSKSVWNLRYEDYRKEDHDVNDVANRIKRIVNSKDLNMINTIVLLFDRREKTVNEQNMESLIVFECDSNWVDSVPKLTTNHFLSFHFNVHRVGGVNLDENAYDEKSDSDKRDFIVRSWLHYGNNHHIRFWPEQLVWFIPRLFVKNEKLSGYQMAERLYSNDYKHGFCVNLSDPVFDRFYKILTSWNHGIRDALWQIIGIDDDSNVSKSIGTYRTSSQMAAISFNLALYQIENEYDRNILIKNRSTLQSGSINREILKHIICLDVLLMIISSSTLHHPPRRRSEAWLLLSERINEKMDNPTVFLSADSRRLLLRKVQWHQHHFVDWEHITSAVAHEMNQAIASSVKDVISPLGKLAENSGNALISAMSVDSERKLTAHEAQYLRLLVHRAVDRTMQWIISDLSGICRFCESKVPKDFNRKWPGLNFDLLCDIWSTHNVFIFGTFNCTEYKLEEFKEEILRAENDIFGKEICSQHVDDLADNKCNLYPSWLIRDDLFEVMKYHFAASQWVHQLIDRNHIREEVNVFCCVIPTAGSVSLYDSNVVHECSIGDIQDYLKSNISFKKMRRTEYEKVDTVDVLEIIDRIEEIFNFQTTERNQFIVLLFDRRLEDFTVFECEAMDCLSEFMTNNFLSLRFNVRRVDGHGVESVNNFVVRSWLHYGNNHHIRFWPEQLVWFIPRLFVKNKKLSGYQMAERLYSNDYKHGFCVNLSDPVFDRFYKILTSWNHQSVNYRRTRWRRTRGIRFGLRDYVEDRMSGQSILKLTIFWNQNGYSSDDILDDIDGPENGSDSNIVAVLGADDGALKELRKLAEEYQKKPDAECTIDHPLELCRCHYVEEMIENLRKFQSENFEVDAENVVEFDQCAMIRGLDHLAVVHNLFSMDNKARIRSYFERKIRCDLGGKCQALHQHCSRRREIGDKPKDKEKNANNSILEVVYGGLCSAHCYLLHSEDTLYRLSGRSYKFEINPFGTEVAIKSNEKENDDDEKKQDISSSSTLSIDFGVHVMKWLPFGVEPMFNSFQEEIIKNPESTLSPQLIDLFRMECIAKLDGEKWTEDNLDEMMSLKLYTDCTKLQNKFRRAYWMRSSLKTKRSFYHWASKMYDTFLFHAQPIPKSRGAGPKTLYHGLNKLFQIDNTAPMYQGPFSTTDSKHVANRFANNQGLIFSVKGSYSNPIRFILGINMIRISCFKHEREILLYSQTLPIVSTETFEQDEAVIIDHLMYSLNATKEEIVDRDFFLKKIGVQFDAKWIPLIIAHSVYQHLTEDKKQAVFSEDTGFGEWTQFLMINDEIECSNSEIRILSTSSEMKENRDQLLSLCVFAVVVDGVSNDKKYRFEDASEFCIPIAVSSLSYPHSVISLFVGPSDGAIDVVVPFKEFPYHPPRYILNQMEPQHITSVMEAVATHGGKLRVHIQSASDIIIEPEGGIKADGVDGMINGGAICLSSNGDIVNHGVLSCNGIEPLGKGGNIYIAADGSITNHGQIECQVNGQTTIQCREFVNDGSISSGTDIWILTGTMQESDAMMVDHLMHKLDSTKRIEKFGVENFFRKCGIHFKSEWIPLILNNPIYRRLEKRKRDIVLSNSIGFGEWTELLQYKDSIICDFVGSQIHFRNRSSRIRQRVSRLLSLCVLAVSVDGILNDRKYRFDESSNFYIPFDIQRMFSLRYPYLIIRLLVGPRDGTVDTVVPFKEFPFHPPRYEMDQEQPLQIESVMKAVPFDANNGYNGVIRIECTSGILIGPNGGINADGAGLNEVNECSIYDQYFEEKNDGKNEMILLRFGTMHFAANRENEVLSLEFLLSGFSKMKKSETNNDDNSESLKSMGAGGGIIALQTLRSITNKGMLSSKGIGDSRFEGGSICLCAQDIIVNQGQIDCGRNGRIIIQCHEFVNEGMISSETETEIMISNKSELSEIEMVMMPWNGCDLKEIPLSVYKNRGSAHKGHPRNLLDKKGTETRYQSANDEPAKGDWITFKIESGSIVIPKAVIIQNYHQDRRGLKSIELSLGLDSFMRDDFDILSEIPHIHRNDNEKQYFPIHNMMMSDASIWMTNYKFLKLRVLENWGYDRNSFYSFSILGIECDSDE